MDLTGKINELTRKYGDPRLGAQARGDLEGMRLLMSCPPVLGVVVDNRDPNNPLRERPEFYFNVSDGVENDYI